VIGHQPAKVAWLGNPGNVATEINLAAVRQSAEQMGIKLELFEAREPTDLDRVFPAMVDCDAVLVQLDPLKDPTASKIAKLAERYRLRAIYNDPKLRR
jgi:ABC-type uncharacterized transport system substrate-binding protein